MSQPLAPPDLPAAHLLRALRNEPGLAGLLGDWDDGGAVLALRPVRVLAPDDDPFEALAEVSRGTWIGYLGYQLGGAVERLPPPPRRPVPLPPHHLALYDHLLRRDPDAGWLLDPAPGADPVRTAELASAVGNALAAAERGGEVSMARPYRCGPFEPDVAGAAHAAAVTGALAHIRDGDVYQVNVCRRLEASFDGDPLDLFLAGQERLRPRFAAFVRLSVGAPDEPAARRPAGAAVVSLSPELFLRRDGRHVLTSPIKGTAPLDADPAALAASAKNRAENVMIVDLMRNDLSRVCEPGSVEVSDLVRAQVHTGVHHLVSDVRGRLRAGVDDGDLLRATFPPGSCTGAPKVRAMEIVHELETTAREVYTGAVGLAGPGGLVLNVAIRTFEVAGGRVWLGVGGGVVAESDPDGEAHETLVKARPLLDAVGASFGPDLAAEWALHEAPVVDRRPDPGGGVFTTALVLDGAVVDLDAHLGRLSASVRECYGLDVPAALRPAVVDAGAALDGRHRLRVTAVPDGGRLVTGITTAEVARVPADPAGRTGPAPWVLVPVVVPGGLGAHKWIDRSAVAEAGEWTDTREPLLLDTDGAVLEAWRGNVLAVLGGVVRTPATDGRILPGTRRAGVIEALRAAGVTVVEGPLTLAELARADEVAVTNAVAGVVPVSAVEGVGTWPDGQRGRALTGVGGGA